MFNSRQKQVFNPCSVGRSPIAGAKIIFFGVMLLELRVLIKPFKRKGHVIQKVVTVINGSCRNKKCFDFT